MGRLPVKGLKITYCSKCEQLDIFPSRDIVSLSTDSCDICQEILDVIKRVKLEELELYIEKVKETR